MRISVALRDTFRRFPLQIATTSGLLVLVGLLEAAALLSVAPVIDALITPDLNGASRLTQFVAGILRSVGVPASLGSFLGVFLLFNLVKGACQALSVYAIVRTKYDVLGDLMIGTFEDCFRARWYFFTSNAQGRLLNIFVRDLMVVGDAFGAMARFVAGIVQFGLCLIVPFAVSWQITSISVAVALLLVWPFVLLGRVNYRLGKANLAATNELTTVVQESLSGAKVILGFSDQRRRSEAFKRAFGAHRRATMMWQTLSRAVPTVYYPVGLSVVIVALVVARELNVPLSEVGVVLYSLLRVIPSIGSIAEEKNGLDALLPNYEQVMDLRREARRLAQPSGTRTFPGFEKEIALQNVSFTHPGRPPTLVEIDLHIPKGKMIALVGESGSGKSTLADVLMGFHEPHAGVVAIDGVSLGEYDIDSYRRRIGYVPQDSVLFNTSVRENLRLATENATEADMVRACRLANASQFVEAWPDGYDTVVGDRGVRLSGGQVQRLALARAILRQPDLLILDEATSALDSASERLIQEAIEAIAKETTVVAIAHRLSTIANADYIYVLNAGRIVEHGTYQRLMALEGSFSRMAELQVLTAQQ